MLPRPVVLPLLGVKPTLYVVPFEQFTRKLVLPGVTAVPAGTVPRSMSAGAVFMAQLLLTVILTLNVLVAVAALATPTKAKAATASRVFLKNMVNLSVK